LRFFDGENLAASVCSCKLRIESAKEIRYNSSFDLEFGGRPIAAKSPQKASRQKKPRKDSSEKKL
jgi:hypothetical protein